MSPDRKHIKRELKAGVTLIIVCFTVEVICINNVPHDSLIFNLRVHFILDNFSPVNSDQKGSISFPINEPSQSI